MKPLFIQFLWGLLMMIGLSFSAQATHQMGRDITYECIGTCTYRIYVSQYFDCESALTAAYLPILPMNSPPSPGSAFSINGGAGCSSPIAVSSWQWVLYTEVTPLCPSTQSVCEDSFSSINGVAQIIYYRDYDFCSTGCTTFTAIYDDCCRSAAITSVAGMGGSAGTSISTEINIAQSPCNNSPVFDILPQFFFCINDTTELLLGGHDPDGDSLQYFLTDCYSDLGTFLNIKLLGWLKSHAFRREL